MISFSYFPPNLLSHSFTPPSVKFSPNSLSEKIQKKTNTEDGFGGFIEEWVKVKDVWAEIKPITIFENFEADRINEKITHTITLRYLSDLKNDNRIKYGNRIFNIKGIINILEENNTLEVKVEEVI